MKSDGWTDGCWSQTATIERDSDCTSGSANRTVKNKQFLNKNNSELTLKPENRKVPCVIRIK